MDTAESEVKVEKQIGEQIPLDALKRTARFTIRKNDPYSVFLSWQCWHSTARERVVLRKNGNEVLLYVVLLSGAEQLRTRFPLNGFGYVRLVKKIRTSPNLSIFRSYRGQYEQYVASMLNIGRIVLT